MVLEPRFLISAFVEDARNEITTFASAEGAKSDSKSLQSLVAIIRYQLETIVISRVDVGVA